MSVSLESSSARSLPATPSTSSSWYVKAAAVTLLLVVVVRESVSWSGLSAATTVIAAFTVPVEKAVVPPTALRSTRLPAALLSVPSQAEKVICAVSAAVPLVPG